MCGITGYWAWGEGDISSAEFEHFNNAQAHRGPDGAGIWQDPRVGIRLGHRRLAIIDLAARANQPLSYANRYWITYNGEIYNYQELRHELQRLGHSFHTTSDTEVILAAYAQWGEACQLKFNGMWAFAIWDAKTRELFMSRDRFGIKPLYYAINKKFIAFASELKAFTQLVNFPVRVREDILAENIVNLNGLEATPHTILAGLHRLRAGHSLRVAPNGRHEEKQWWRTLDHLPDPSADPVAEFHDILTDACRLRLRSDVPVGTSLSGGLDSSSIVALVAEALRLEHGQHRQHTFTAAFSGTEQDELNYAQAVSAAVGATQTVREMSATPLADTIDQVIWQQEDLYWVPMTGAIEIYAAMREQGITVTLDGHGADELLAGYHFFAAKQLLRTLGPGPTWGHWSAAWQALQAFQGGSVTNIPTNPYIALWQALNATTTAAHMRRAVQKIRPPGWLRQPIISPQLYYAGATRVARELPPLARDTYETFHATTLPTILRNFDRVAMASGVEIRMPFLDWRLVCFAFSLPDNQRIRGKYAKYVLRAAMRGRLPETVRLRTNKVGFSSPLAAWLAGPLRTWLTETVNDHAFLDSSIWDGPAIQNYVERAVRNERWDDLPRVWPYVHAHRLSRLLTDVPQPVLDMPTPIAAQITP